MLYEERGYYFKTLSAGPMHLTGTTGRETMTDRLTHFRVIHIQYTLIEKN